METQRIVPVLAGLTENSSNEERKLVAFETLFKIRNVTIATVDGDKPAARTYDCAQLDDGNIYFTTYSASISSVSKPLSTDLDIALNASTKRSRVVLSGNEPNLDIPAPTKATPLPSLRALRLMVPPSQ